MGARIIARYQGIPIWEGTPTYEQWCEENGFHPEDDENYNAYCEWYSNRR